LQEFTDKHLSWPQFNLLPVSWLLTVLDQRPIPPLPILIVRKIQLLDLFRANNHYSEILPGSRIVEVVYFLPYLERWILGNLRSGLTRRRAFECT
jgi:hypothetical protein